MRADAAEIIRRLWDKGIGRIVLATGDRADLAGEVARRLELDAVRAELAPVG